MTGPLQLTTARWCNRPQPKEDNPGYCAKIHAHTGPFTQYEYGTDTPFGLPGNHFRYPLEGDGPLQASVVCAPQTFVLGDDIDNPAAFAVSQTGKLLSRDDAWCTRGDGWHAPVDCRGLDTGELKQGPAGWGDIKWKGFLPFPRDCVHYTGQPYAGAGSLVIAGSWGNWRVTGMAGGDRAAEILAANMADRAAFAEAKAAAREAARAAVAAGSEPKVVAKAARAAAVSCWHGQDATGTHRELLMELLWECGRAHMTEEQAYEQWLLYSAPWDLSRPWTDGHFRNMWQDVPRKIAEQEAEREQEAAEAAQAGWLDVENAARAGRQLRAELGRGRLAGLYLRDGVLVHTPRVGEDGYIPPNPAEAARGVDHGPAQVRQAEQNHVRSLVEVRFGVFKPVRDPKTHVITDWSDALFPADAARHAVGAAELGMGCPNLRHLAGITHTPVLRPDGTVLGMPGHDAETGLLYLPDRGLVVPPVPEHPSAQQVADAVALLRWPVSLFPWVSPLHHEANWLGAMLTPLLRLLLPPPYPMLIITATNAGSGKTLLLRLIGIVHGIATRGEFPREREELRKLIVSTLHTTTAPVIGLDNVRGTIYSSELEALLTARTITDRELGHSRNITVTNDRLWAATGNNARIGGDLARRCLPVALDPRCADPYKRTFAFDPAEWMTANRGAYIAALLTVARGWVLAGEPAADPGRSDDYRRWYGSLRGLLAWAGVPGEFGASTGDLSVVSEDDAEWGVFVAELFRVFADEAFTTADIIGLLDRPLTVVPAPARSPMEEFMDERPHVLPGERIAADCLPGELAEKWATVRYEKTSGFARSLGKWLSYRDGRFTADGLTVRMQTGRRARFTIEGAG